MSQAVGTRRRGWFLAWRMLRIPLLVYVGLIGRVMFYESYFIYPAPKYPQGDWSPTGLKPEDAWFSSADGTKLHGWFLPHPQGRGAILYCHGNGENVAYNGELIRFLRNRYRVHVMVFDYRGYGRSEGKPFERGVVADGLAAQDWLAARTGCRPEEVVLMGRSIGGAVAVQLAAERGARGLVLESTFPSLPDVAARIFPWLPVRWLMRNRYNSLRHVARYEGPLLQCHGADDELIPCEFGRRLFDAAPGADKEFIEVPGGHNDPPNDAYYERLGQFLDSVLPPAASLPATSSPP